MATQAVADFEVECDSVVCELAVQPSSRFPDGETHMLDTEEKVGIDGPAGSSYTFTVGRSAACDVELADPSVSQHHADIGAPRPILPPAPPTQQPRDAL